MVSVKFNFGFKNFQCFLLLFNQTKGLQDLDKNYNDEEKNQFYMNVQSFKKKKMTMFVILQYPQNRHHRYW